MEERIIKFIDSLFSAKWVRHEESIRLIKYYYIDDNEFCLAVLSIFGKTRKDLIIDESILGNLNRLKFKKDIKKHLKNTHDINLYHVGIAGFYQDIIKNKIKK